MRISKSKKIVLAGILIIALGTLTYGYSSKKNDPYSGTVDTYKEFEASDKDISKEEAREDLEYLYDKVSKKHLSALNGVPEAFEKQYIKEISNLESIDDVLELWKASSRIIKTLNDAHSAIYYFADDKVISASFLYEDDILYFKDDINFSEWREVVSIAGVDTSKVFENFLSQFSYENIYWANNRFPMHLTSYSSLKWLGLSFDDSVKIVVVDGGIEKTIDKYFKVKTKEARPSSSDYKFVDYKIMSEYNLGVFSLYECNYNEEYRETLKSFFDDVKDNNIGNIAIDLRFNGGGNSRVADEFIRYIDVDECIDFGVTARFGNSFKEYKSSMKKNQKFEDAFAGDIYVLTSNATFSSATMFSTLLSDNKMAKVIGEPSGNKPSAFGDVLTFQLPNSGLVLKTTFKEFIRPDIEKTNKKYLEVDYKVKSKKVYDVLFEIVDR